MAANPCHICGGTDLNLVDGFYYCVECGTQDVTARETVVERTILADGTCTISSRKKFSTVLKDAVQMSGDWHKWHTFNFMLAGLTEELLELGAKPTVKKKILWIWIRYIKMFQKKDEEEPTQFVNDSTISENHDISQELNKDESVHSDEISDDDIQINQNKRKRSQKAKGEKSVTFTRDITVVTIRTLLTILYLALNLDKSDIQLSHLFRFIKEERLSVYNCMKFVPKELSVKLIPNWDSFARCTLDYSMIAIRETAMTFFKRLKLGMPLVPDLNKIIHNYVKELCLPDDFKDLVLSLINHSPCNFLQMVTISKKRYTCIPDYETVCMTYILVALKICFGLDCDYEIKLSDAVDKINCEENHLKSYKLGMYSDVTDRLFSFKEWCMFLQFRKQTLCKYYLHMARHYDMPVDDCVFMEHLEERNKRKIRLSDDVTMDILNKIHLEDVGVIPKKEFPATFTPMTTFSEIISQHIQDYDLKLRLCEDFTRYSLRYATTNLKFPGYNDYNDLLRGVSKENKLTDKNIIGTLKSANRDEAMVLVRNCDNKNWVKTKPPKMKHVTKIKRNNNDSEKDSDYGYDSSIEHTSEESDASEIESNEKVSTKDFDDEINCDVIEEEDEGLSIFDDEFDDLEDDKKAVTHVEEIVTSEIHGGQNHLNFTNENHLNFQDSETEVNDNRSEISTGEEIPFNPETFDRQSTIQELIKIACKKYKIPVPKERKPTEPRKRKKVDNNEAGGSSPKKKRSNHNRMRSGESMKITQKLIDTYYENLNNDLLAKISNLVRSVVQMTDYQDDRNNANHDETLITNQCEIDLQNIHNTNEEHLNVTENDQNPLAENASVQSVTLNDTIDDENYIEELLPKNNPKFDPKTHDIKQLYLNIQKEQEDISYVVDIESDAQIDKIIEKEISEFAKGDRRLDKHAVEQDALSVSEDDMPLSVLSQKLSRAGKKRGRPHLTRLIQNTQLKDFRYWTRHYNSSIFLKRSELTATFNVELTKNLPTSFVFVIGECAGLLNCTTFCLYKRLQGFEKRLFNGGIRK